MMKFSSIPLQLQGVLILIALFSFAISYNNLHDMALQMGIPSYLAWFFPFCIDAFLLACSIFILYAEEKGIAPIEGWAFLLVYTGLSIVFNVIHSPDVFWYQVGYSACPVSLCISLHLFVKVIKHEMIHDEVKEEVIVKEEIKEEIVEVKIEEKKETDLTDNQIKVRDVFKEDEKITMAEACRRTGLSFKTVKAHYNKLTELGMI